VVVSLRLIPRRGRKKKRYKICHTYISSKAKKHKWIYVGSTRNLESRIEDHNNKKVKSTKFYAPFELIYYEVYNTYSLARKREIELKKHGQQKEILLKRLGLT
jgi:putative endonuclease